jgi:glycosyltransferase involved in cell wall biosynthesis
MVIVFAGVKYEETLGQRSLWLARTLLRRGYRVVYVYWRWGPDEQVEQDARQPRLHQMGIDEFWRQWREVLGERWQGEKLFLVEYPHPSLFRIINQANGQGWVTILDQIDDWGEFHKLGQAVWYSEAMETYLYHNVDVLIASAVRLREKMQVRVGREVHIVANAYEPSSLGVGQAVKELERGRVTLGYFGHLTGAWFDWGLVKWLAERHADWVIYLIGYGNEEQELAGNVRLLGRVEHGELAGYAVNWDVGLIPFQVSELVRGVDPLKVYEYLAMGLPVVASGMPHLGEMPGVSNADSWEEYEAAVEKAVRVNLDRQAVEQFLHQHTWEQRVDHLLDLTSKQKKSE